MKRFITFASMFCLLGTCQNGYAMDQQEPVQPLNLKPMESKDERPELISGVAPAMRTSPKHSAEVECIRKMAEELQRKLIKKGPLEAPSQPSAHQTAGIALMVQTGAEMATSSIPTTTTPTASSSSTNTPRSLLILPPSEESEAQWIMLGESTQGNSSSETGTPVIISGVNSYANTPRSHSTTSFTWGEQGGQLLVTNAAAFWNGGEAKAPTISSSSSALAAMTMATMMAHASQAAKKQ